MNLQSPYVDAKYSYVDVARSFDKSTVSASPSFNYLQEPMENNLRAATFYPSNLRHVKLNSHASAIPEIHMLMNTMMSSINQYETPNARNFYNMQGSVSSFYSSASDS